MALPWAFEFEESVFEGGGQERREARSALSPAYSARCCERQWFCEETDGEDAAQSITIKKFRGDLAYKQQEFKKALGEYSSCFTLLPTGNVAMRRDVQESQARCLAHLGRHKEALDITETLRNGATNTDHLTVVLGLQFAIYRTLDQTEKMIGCLKQLISLHPFHPGNWKRLAEAYMSLLKLPKPFSVSKADLQRYSDLNTNNCSQLASVPFRAEASFQHREKYGWRKDLSLQLSPETTVSFGSCEESKRIEGPLCAKEKLEGRYPVKKIVCGLVGQEELENICLYAFASFIRARLLLQLTQLHQSSFPLESNLRAQQEIEDKVTSFGLKEDALFLVTEIMGEDLTPEKLKEDAQGEVKCIGTLPLTSIMSASAAEFETKWFQKLRDNLPHLDCWL